MADDGVPRFTVELFSGPRVRLADGRVVTFQAKPGTILTLVALASGARRTREELLEALWPDEDPEATRPRLRVALAALRREIPGGHDLVLADGSAVWLNLRADVRIDTVEFDRLREQARAAAEKGDPDRQIDLLSRASELCTGPVTPKVYADDALRAREHYELKAAELRRCLARLRADRDAAMPMAPAERAPAPSDAPAAPAASPPAPAAPRRNLAPWLVACTAVLACVALWVWTRPEPTPAERIHILDSLRYASAVAETPDELNARRRAQAEQCLALADGMWKASYGPDEQAWIERLQPVDADIQHSIAWLTENEPDKAVQLIGALSRYWWIPDRRGEPREWLDTAFKRASHRDSEPLARAIALHAMCVLQSIGMTAPEARQANARALAEIQRAHAMYTRIGSGWGQAHTIRCTAHVLHALGRDAEALRCFDEALHRFEAMGDISGQAYVYWGMGLLKLPGESDYACMIRQDRAHLRSAQLFRKAGNAYGYRLAVGEVVTRANWLLQQLRSHRDPDVPVLLRGFASEYKSVLNWPKPIRAPVDADRLHRLLARVSICLNDRRTAVEQLGCLLMEDGWPHAVAKSEMVEIEDAYIRNANDTPRPPMPVEVARSVLRQHASAASLRKHLTLEQAVEIVSR